MCELKLSSRFKDFSIIVQANIIPTPALIYKIPASVSKQMSKTANSLNFVELNLKYDSIDMILGAEFYPTCSIGNQAIMEGLSFVETEFGWTPMGTIQVPALDRSVLTSSCCHLALNDIDKQIKLFWKIEEAESISDHSDRDNCESYFETTHYRLPNS